MLGIMAQALGHQGAGHAGCFVRRGNEMLAVKLTYDGRKYDIPGGQTNWKEPASRTAVRETWEESGYRVTAGKHLATVRGGFHIYECFLEDGNPSKGPDHEISEVKWMSKGDVQHQMNRGMWRFQRSQAYLYLRWLGGRSSTESTNTSEVAQNTSVQMMPNATNATEGPRRLFLLV